MKLLLLLFITIQLKAAVVVLYTNDYTGKLFLECGDTIVVHPNNRFMNEIIPRCINVVQCETEHCRESIVEYLKKKWKTRGIAVGDVR